MLKTWIPEEIPGKRRTEEADQGSRREALPAADEAKGA